MNAKKSTWIGGTAFVAVILMAMSWFLLVSPVLATAAETNEQTADTEALNADLQIKVNKLKADFAHLDEYKAELAKIATQITPELDLAPYILQIDKIATDAELSVQTIEPLAPYLVTLPEGSGQPAASASGAQSTEAAPTASPTPSPSASAGSGATAAPAAPAEVAAPDGMTAVPVTITVVGTYEDAVTFLDDIQNTKRLFLVAAVTGTVQDEKAAEGSRPATELGDLELKVEGFLYVLPSLAPAPDPDAKPTKEPKMPKPTDRNPVLPIEGDDLPVKADD